MVTNITRPLPLGWGIGLACVGGLVLGVFGAFIQAARCALGDFSFPWGTLLMLAALVVAVRAGVSLLASRWGGVLVFAGWLVATVVFATRTPWSGDLIIASGTWQFVYLLGGLILGSAAATVVARSPALLPADPSTCDPVASPR